MTHLTKADIAMTIEAAGDALPRNECRSFWRDFCEAIAHAIEEDDPQTLRDELAALLLRYSVDQ